MQSTARHTTAGTAGTAVGASATADLTRPAWLTEVGENLLLLTVSVAVTAAVTVLAHLTLSFVNA